MGANGSRICCLQKTTLPRGKAGLSLRGEEKRKFLGHLSGEAGVPGPNREKVVLGRGQHADHAEQLCLFPPELGTAEGFILGEVRITKPVVLMSLLTSEPISVTTSWKSHVKTVTGFCTSYVLQLPTQCHGLILQWEGESSTD